VAVVLVSAESRERERQAGYGPGPSSDIAILVGPFLTTPDELETDGGWVDRAWQATLRRNQLESATMPLEAPVTEMLVTASRSSALAAGDLLLTSPVFWEAEEDLLLPADQASCGIPGLGELHFTLV
jgi:2-keto-4-pentenoate hydratase/2-oxohepta-3-ene-1,7-dioic acid hydratase in catechol pathway